MKIAVFLLLGILLAILTLSSAKPGEKHETEKHTEESAAKGGGKGVKGKAYSKHKAGKTSNYASNHNQESGKHGSEGSELHRVEDLDKGGKKHKHFHADKHESFHKSGGESAHGAKFEEASKRHKGNYKKGFLEKFHKDELMKHDSFFNNGEQAGSYDIFGKKGSKYGSAVYGKTAGGTFKNLKTEGKHSKSGKKVGGHNKADKKGHKSSKSSKSHYAKGGSYAKKEGKKGGKQYKFKH